MNPRNSSPCAYTGHGSEDKGAQSCSRKANLHAVPNDVRVLSFVKLLLPCSSATAGTDSTSRWRPWGSVGKQEITAAGQRMARAQGWRSMCCRWEQDAGSAGEAGKHGQQGIVAAPVRPLTFFVVPQPFLDELHIPRGAQNALHAHSCSDHRGQPGAAQATKRLHSRSPMPCTRHTLWKTPNSALVPTPAHLVGLRGFSSQAHLIPQPHGRRLAACTIEERLQATPERR